MTAKELIEILKNVPEDAMILTASKRMVIEDADYVGDVILLRSMNEEFTAKAVLVTE